MIYWVQQQGTATSTLTLTVLPSSPSSSPAFHPWNGCDILILPTPFSLFPPIPKSKTSVITCTDAADSLGLYLQSLFNHSLTLPWNLSVSFASSTSHYTITLLLLRTDPSLSWGELGFYPTSAAHVSSSVYLRITPAPLFLALQSTFDTNTSFIIHFRASYCEIWDITPLELCGLILCTDLLDHRTPAFCLLSWCFVSRPQGMDNNP